MVPGTARIFAFTVLKENAPGSLVDLHPALVGEFILRMLPDCHLLFLHKSNIREFDILCRAIGNLPFINQSFNLIYLKNMIAACRTSYAFTNMTCSVKQTFRNHRSHTALRAFDTSDTGDLFQLFTAFETKIIPCLLYQSPAVRA